MSVTSSIDAWPHCSKIRPQTPDAVYNEASDQWSITLRDHGFLFFAVVRDPATVIVLRLVVGLG